MSDLMWFIVSSFGCIVCFLIIETIFYFLKKTELKKTWVRCDSIERKVSDLQNEIHSYVQESYIFKGDFKTLASEMRRIEIELVKIQTRLEERQTKHQEPAQISYKNPVGRPAKVTVQE